MTPILRSARTVSRTWTISDLPLAEQLWGDADVARFLDARIHLSESQIRERLLNEIANLEQHGVQYWPAFLIDGDMFIGCCGLKPYKPELNLFELGFHLCRPFWGQGYATELGRAVIRHAFYDLQLPALFAGHHPDNDRSRRVLEKLGFRYTHDEFYAPTDVVEPCYRLDRESAIV